MKKATSILLLSLMYLMSMAQKNQPAELQFNRLFVNDGLPESYVTALVQDKQGYMWIGTQNGLVRYDGYAPKVYNFGINDPYKRSIGSIFLDREGRLWVGGGFETGSLYLYNRAEDRFISYKPDSSATDSLPHAINGIYQDRKGLLWLISYNDANKKGRLDRFDPATKKFATYYYKEKGAHNLNTKFITNFIEDEKTGMWVGSSNGIYQYNEKTDHFDPHLAATDSAKQNTYYLTSSAEPGLFWISGRQTNPPNKGLGLSKYDTRTNTVTEFRNQTNDSSSIASDNTRWIRSDSLRRLWIATDKGLSLFVPEKNNFINYQLKDKSDGRNIGMVELQADLNNNLWLTSQRGLVFFNSLTKTFTLYPAHEKDPHGLTSNNIYNLFIDPSGILWFGSGAVGLQWINKPYSKFIKYKDNPGQPHHFSAGLVTGFAESNDSSIWLATLGGLYRWQPRSDSFKLEKFSKTLSKDFYTTAIIADKQGRIWFGAGDNAIQGKQGLYCYDPKTGQTKYFGNDKKDTTSLSGNYIGSLLQDHLGNIWVGTGGGGMCRYNEKLQNFTRYPFNKNTTFNRSTNGALDDDGVQVIYEDKSGTIWVGTNNGGLNRFNREAGTFTSYNQQLPGFSCVISIYEDARNLLWVGTYFGGVFSFDSKTSQAKMYSEKDGLLYNGASGIIEDNKENLWLASYRGISIFSPQRNKVRNLTIANGLPSENLTTAFKTSSGQFLFSGNDGGFFSFSPEDLTPDLHTPMVHIETVDIAMPDADKAKDSTLIIFGKDSISFRYNENRLSFHYVGLYYQNPQLNQYSYKLDGYDKDWIAAGTQRMATYTNLSPGHYTFHVKAANSDGVWNEKGASFSFTILPPWWKTWWAYCLYIMLFGGSIWAFIHYRSKALRRENQVLEEKVNHRTSQLQNSLRDLQATQSQLIQSEKMASLGELTAGIAHEIQNPLNFVNNFSEVNTELIEELVEEVDKGNTSEVKAIAKDIKENEQKINHHGKRADAIVKGMLQHSRSSNGQKEPTDINALADEYLRLAYHGLRAKDKSFNATLKTDYDEKIDKINVIPQDIGRVILNLITNAFYVVNEKALSGVSATLSAASAPTAVKYEPIVSVSTKKEGNKILISVKDNGNGIPQKVLDKIFQPFFTTKPTGQGTGLGLSLSYDIVKSHGGELKVETLSAEAAAQAGIEGEGTIFIISIPV